MLFGLLLIVGIGIAVAVGVFSYQAEQKRRAALALWAQQRGWTYQRRDDAILSRFDGSPFETGHSRKATNVMVGTLGERRAAVFGFQYTVSNGKSSTTYHFRVFAVAMPCMVGHLSIKPEGLIAKLGNKLGFADVQLESEAFNHAFRLTASSQKLAYDLVPARTIDLLLGHRGTTIQTEGDLLTVVEDGRLDAVGLDGTLAMIDQFIDNVPPFVWNDHGAPRADDRPPAS